MARTGSLTPSRIQYRGWDAWELVGDDLALILVPQVGGRIMDIRWRGHGLLFFDPRLAGKVANVAAAADVRAKKRALGFPYWGGDKTWLAPQSGWTEDAPFLDLDSGSYEFSIIAAERDRSRVKMTSPVCRETGAQIIRDVEFIPHLRQWTVTHSLTNPSARPIRWGLWSVSMVLRPARVYLPRSAASRYPQGVKTFVEEGESASIRRRVVGDLGNLASVDCFDRRKFKFGVDAPEGWILGVIEVPRRGLAGYLKRFPVFPQAHYAHGCAAEVFCSGEFDYFEMEIHGPVVDLEPGETFSFTEEQRIFDIARWPSSEEELRRWIDT